MPAAADVALIAAEPPPLHTRQIDGVVGLALGRETSLGATALEAVRGLERVGGFELG